MSSYKTAFNAGDFATARRLAYEELAEIADPGSDGAIDARVHMAVCDGKLGDPKRARDALFAELERNDAPRTRWLVCQALRRCGFYGEAMAQYDYLLAAGVRHREMLNQADLMIHFGRWAEAEELLREALAQDEGHRRAAGLLDRLLSDPGGPAAQAVLDTRARQDRAYPRQRVSLALALLAQGKWREAWPYYESRIALGEDPVSLPYPEWDRLLDPKKVILVRADQGAGDCFMFGRFATMLAALGQTVVVMANARLNRILSTLPGVANVISPSQRIENAEVAWISLESLPGFLGLTPKTIPSMPAYLSAERERVDRWAGWLPQEGVRVGIAWQGAVGGMVDEGRSIPLGHFAQVAGLPSVSLVSLQQGEGTEQIADCGFGERIIQPGPDFDPPTAAFTDTAAMMMSLDLVITSDTSIAHLAGALGRPVFLAVKKYPEWRWCGEGETTPWYPSMRLFRQETDGDWDDVFARTAAAVRAHFDITG